MPTLASLLERELISRIEVALERDVSPLRLLYGTEAFLEWVARAPSFQRGVGDWPDQTPAEQLDWLFYRFTSGMPMIPLRDFRVLRHEARPARELKTPDLRVFGWLAKRDCFIAAFGDWADKVKDHGLYRGYRLEIRRLRRQWGAELDLCVEGEAFVAGSMQAPPTRRPL